MGEGRYNFKENGFTIFICNLFVHKNTEGVVVGTQLVRKVSYISIKIL